MQKPGLFGMNGFVLFLLAFCPFALQAQQAGSLILIDAENKQSFTVRVGDQLYASSGHGHVVLPHLVDSTYRLNIRFPKKNLAEQVFPVVIRSRDQGFQLKGADSTWVLYNWQTRVTIRAVNEPDSSRILEMGIRREDGFANLMAAVVNDTSVMYNTYKGNGFGRDSSVAIHQLPTGNGQPQKANGQRPSSSDSLLAKGEKPPVNRQPPAINLQRPNKPIQPALVKKLRDVNLKISRKMVFLDRGVDGQTDTVTLFVYFEVDSLLRKPAVAEPIAIKKTPGSDSAGSNKPAVKNKASKTADAVCSQLASDTDVEFLRSAILKANTDQEKISVATGAFALKCFSVSQIRILAALFVSDKSKYRLMDAAHLHVADRDHFRELVDMYTDKNFQKKFLLMAERRS